MKNIDETFVIINNQVGNEIQHVSFDKDELIEVCNKINREQNDFYKKKNKNWIDINYNTVVSLREAIDIFEERTEDRFNSIDNENY